MTLATLDTATTCPDCGGRLHLETVREDALVRACGYGATRRTVTRWCPACGWQVQADRSEERPPRTGDH